MGIGLDGVALDDGLVVHGQQIVLFPVKFLAADGADMPVPGLVGIPAVVVRHMDMLRHFAGAGEHEPDIAIPLASHALIQEGVVKSVAVVPLINEGGIRGLAVTTSLQQDRRALVSNKRFLHGSGDAGNDKCGDTAGDVDVGTIALYGGQLFLGVGKLQLQLLNSHVLLPHVQLGEGRVVGEQHIALFDLLPLLHLDLLHRLCVGEVDGLQALYIHHAFRLTGVAPVVGHGKIFADVVDLDFLFRPVGPGISAAKDTARQNEQRQRHGNDPFSQFHTAPPVWMRPSRMR